MGLDLRLIQEFVILRKILGYEQIPIKAILKSYNNNEDILKIINIYIRRINLIKGWHLAELKDTMFLNAGYVPLNIWESE